MKRLYDYRWQQARALFLKKHSLCVFCLRRNVTSSATVVDHIKPHKGDRILFWDEKNWQSLCKKCHDSDKKRIEEGSYAGCDVEGNLFQ